MTRILPLTMAALVLGCGPSVPADDPGAAPLPECTADLDGAISLDELPLAPGIDVRYTRNAVGEPIAADPDGLDDGDGERVWDFSAGADAIGATLSLIDPAAAPHADLFPDATYVAPLALETPDLLGWFRLDEHGDGSGELLMLGMATAEGVASASRTEVVYDEPLVLYRFPFAVGDSWEQTVSYRDAVAFGIPEQGSEHYRFEVDAAGTVRLPGGIEVSHALRVRVDVDQTLAIAQGAHTRSVHQLLWVRPCFGELGRMVSTDPTFATVDEFRRYYP
jgi:hypothetical protein